MYEVEITFHQGADSEFTYEGIFATLDESVRFLENHASGHMLVDARINNVKVNVISGCVLGPDGEALCTNPRWHEIFAKPEEKIAPFIPQPVHAPHNPATLISLGKDKA